MPELSDCHETVQHISDILSVHVMEFYIYLMVTCSYKHVNANMATSGKKITVVFSLQSSVENVTTLCTYTVLLLSERSRVEREM